MNNPDPEDREMHNTHGSSSVLDDARSDVGAGRLKGAQLRPRYQLAITESAADYADLFRTLQIRPDLYERFLDGVLKVIRQKNIKELQRATDASIKQLSSLVLRGYRNIVWKKGSTWLLEDSELKKGEKRLLHGADNEKFYPLLEPIWWRMRDLVFEPKPPRAVSSGRKRNAHAANRADDAYEADNDTEIDTRSPHDRARDQTLRKITKALANNIPHASTHSMSADETDEAIVDLVVRLADTRARSNPAIFQQLWNQHVGRVEELEYHHSGTDQAKPVIVQKIPAAAASIPGASNLSNEPFATVGNPVLQAWPLPVPAQVPAVMAVFITTAPAESPYTQHAYEWLDAPVRMVDQHMFFNGVMLRVSMRAERVKGVVLSYGWCDVCRWITTTGIAGRKEGWSVLQRDLAWAAERGVRVWRMKVLVVDT